MNAEKEEYKELLAVIAEAIVELGQISSKKKVSADDLIRINSRVMETCNNRLFTSFVVDVLQLPERWNKEAGRFLSGDEEEVSAAAQAFGSMLRDLRAVAIKQVDS